MAVSDTVGAWCAEFKNDSARGPVQPGEHVAIVFTRGGSGATTTLDARVRVARTNECWAAFPQPRWIDYTAYDLDLTRPVPEGTPTVGLAATGRGLGSLELRRCSADEGEHFTVWEVKQGRPRRIWHEYYDWGAFTDPTCRSGENGLDSTSQ